jgi:hypothetical protein
MKIIAVALYALGMFGLGSEFAWHSWRAIIRLFLPRRGLGGTFYSLLSIAAAFGIWIYTDNWPSIWVLIVCALLMPVSFLWLRVGAFDSLNIFGVDTDIISAVDDLRSDAKGGRVQIQDTINRMEKLAENHSDFRIRRFIVTSIGDLADPNALTVCRRFLKDTDWQVQYAAILAIKRIRSRLDANGVFSVEEARDILFELQAHLNAPNCDSRLMRLGTELRDGLKNSVDRFERR